MATLEFSRVREGRPNERSVNLLKGSTSASGDLISCRELAHGLVGSTVTNLAIEQNLAVLVPGDDYLRGVDATVDGRTVNLLPGDALDVDDPLPTVDLHDLALSALVGAAHHLHFVVLPHRD